MTLQNTDEVKRMTENIIKLDLNSYVAMCKTIDELTDKNDFLQRQVNALRLNNRELTSERNRLNTELMEIKSMGMFEFGNTYCSDDSLEASGKAFARALGVGQ